MTRRLLNLVTGLSLLVCVAVCGLWVCSYCRSDWITCTRQQSRDVMEWMALCGKGTVRLSVMEYQWNRGFAEHWGDSEGWHWTTQKPFNAATVFIDAPTWLNCVGFHWVEYRNGGINPGTYRSVALPLWFAAILSGLTPAARLYGCVRRPRAGHCSQCGYDLRATPGRCPECGRKNGDVSICC
jgi:hypothetical protein